MCPTRTIQTAVAARFCVSVSFIEKLRQLETGSVAALPHRSGPAPLLNTAARPIIIELTAGRPSAASHMRNSSRVAFGCWRR